MDAKVTNIGPNFCVNSTGWNLWVGNASQLTETCAYNGAVISYYLGDTFGDVTYADWCLVPYTGQTLPTPGACPSGDLQDPQTHQCYAPPDKNAGQCKDCVGDPINPGSGNHYEIVTDYQGGGAFPLVFRRTYNSGIANEGSNSSVMGAGWTTGVTGAHLSFYTQPESYIVCADPSTGTQYICPTITGDSEGSVTVWHGDGSQDVFTGELTLGGLPDSALVPEQGSVGELSYASGVFTYQRTDGYTEKYNSAGQLTEVDDPRGLKQIYGYVGGQLTSITDPNGRQISFAYDTSSRLQTLTVPALNAASGTATISYGYDASGNLQTATYQDGRVVAYEYNDSNLPHALTGLKDENGNEYAAWSYNDTSGKTICSEHAPSGNIPSTAYTCINDTGGVDKTVVTYNADGSTDVTGPTGLVSHMTFQNVNGKLLLATMSARCPDCGNPGHQIDYNNSGNGQISDTYDFDGNETTYSLDSNGFEQSRTEAANDTSLAPSKRTIATTWYTPTGGVEMGLPKTITEYNAAGTALRATTWCYNSVSGSCSDGAGTGNVWTRTVSDLSSYAAPNGNLAARTTTYTYSGGFLTAVQGPLTGVNDTTTLVYYSAPNAGYNNANDLKSVTDGLGHSTTVTQYSAAGFPLSVEDANSVYTTFAYDARGRLLNRVVDAGGGDLLANATTSYSYYPNGTLHTVVLPITQAGHDYMTYVYDNAHRLTTATDDLGNKVSYAYSYNPGNNSYLVEEQRFAPGSSTPAYDHQSTRYDGAANLDPTLSQNKRVEADIQSGTTLYAITYTLDPNGNVTLMSDLLGHSTRRYFDTLNRLQSSVDPKGNSTSYNLDALDRLTDITSPRGLNTGYTYDAYGELLGLNSPDTGTTTNDYSQWVSGAVINSTDARGIVTTYVFDALSRLTDITRSDSSRNVTYSYDTGVYGIGRRSGMTDSTGTTSYQYDSHGNMVQKSVTLGSHTFNVGYSYDAADDKIGMTYPSGLQVSYKRDSTARTYEVDANGSPLASSIGYEPFGPVAGLTYGNGLQETRGYDTAYRLKNINAAGIQSWAYNYFADGTLQQLADSTGNSNLASFSQTFTYDPMQRVVTASGAYGSLSIGADPVNHPEQSYDLDGNRTQLTVNGATTAYTYDTASNRLTAIGSQNVQVNAAGSITGDGSHIYSYDVAGRLSGYDNLVDTYKYNGLGQRAVKDTTVPTISLTAPLGSSFLSGTVSVTATAGDSFSVGSVEFWVDGARVATMTNTPPSSTYAYSWHTTAMADGTHTLTVVAYDAEGNSTRSAPVSVTVDNTSPTVSVTAPANSTYLKGTVSVTAGASDNISVASVQFQLDGANLGVPVTVTPYTTSWDTTTAAGGAHTLKAIATDEAGNTTTSAAVSVTVDNTPPTVSITAPAGGAELPAATNVTLSATASDNVSVASVQFQVDGASLGAPVTAAPYSVSWNTASAAGGSHSLTAVATDEAGNTTTSTAVSVTVDESLPTIAVTAPAGGADIRGTVTVTATASDSDGISSVQFQLDGANLGTPVSTAPYTVSWNTTTATGGTHTLKAIGTDKAGNTTTSAAASVTVDNTPPTVSITAPAGGAYLGGTVSVSANASDNITVASVQFQLDGANLGAPVTAAPYTVYWNTTTATEGTHTLTAIATDGAGNTTTSAAVSVTVDNDPPTVGINTPLNVTTGNNDVKGTVSVTASASDNAGVASVQFQLDGVNLGSAITTAPYSYSWNTTTASDGTHTLTAIAKDPAGNVTTSTAVSVTVDNTPPTVGINTPLNATTGNNDVKGTVTLGVTASASYNVGIKQVQYLVDGVAKATVTSGSSFAYPWNTTGYTDGVHTLTAIATDNAGNSTTSASVSATVDNTPPTNVAVTSPPAGNVSDTVTVTASASDATSGVKNVQFILDGNTSSPLGTATGSSYSIPWTTSTATPGSHTLTAIATDNAGNATTSASVSVTVIPSTPTIQSSSYWVNPGQAYTISWSVPGTVTSYNLEIDPGPNATTVSTTATSKTYSHPLGDVDWYYQVQACYGTQCGPWSSTIDVYIQCTGTRCTAAPVNKAGTKPQAMIEIKTAAPAESAAPPTPSKLGNGGQVLSSNIFSNEHGSK